LVVIVNKLTVASCVQHSTETFGHNFTVRPHTELTDDAMLVDHISLRLSWRSRKWRENEAKP